MESCTRLLCMLCQAVVMSTSTGSSMAAKLEEMLQAVWDVESKVNDKLLAMKRKWSPLTIGWWSKYIGIHPVRGLGSLPGLRLLTLNLVHISCYLDHGHHQFWGGDCLDLCAYKWSQYLEKGVLVSDSDLIHEELGVWCVPLRWLHFLLFPLFMGD